MGLAEVSGAALWEGMPTGIVGFRINPSTGQYPNCR